LKIIIIDENMTDNINIKENAVFQKKHWISITGLCNNNCTFCLDGHRPDKSHKDKDIVLKELKIAYDSGARKAVISGGDPSIHPDFIDIISETKKIGYDKIQIVTNGRMLSSFNFLTKAVRSGLSEVTFSLHGHTAELHDSFTQSVGSFSQIIKRIKNAMDIPNLIVNADTVITSKNYRHLRDIFFLLYHLGVREINFMSLVLNGNAYNNRSELIYDLKEVTPYVKEVIDLAKENNVVFWLSRYPPEYLEEYEEFVEDPHKMVDDVKGMWRNVFANSDVPHCKGVRCDYCGIRLICPSILETKKRLNSNLMIKNESWKIISLSKDFCRKSKDEILNMIVSDKDYMLELSSPGERLSEYADDAVKLSDTIESIKTLSKIVDEKGSNLYYRGIPKCLIFDLDLNMKHSPVSVPNIEKLDSEQDYLNLSSKLSSQAMIKPMKCAGCIFYGSCDGIFIQYFRKFGSFELSPKYSREIRINLDCNQNCLFCNTDSNAENVITDISDIMSKLEEWKNKNVLQITITGREPTLNPDLVKIVKKAKDLDYKQIDLQTNAILLSDVNRVHLLKKAGLDSAFVSIHAHNEDLSAKITRAPGTFDKTVEGVKNLIDNGISVVINLVINSYNYKKLLEIVKFIHENLIIHHRIVIRKIVLSYVSPICTAWDNKDIIPKFSDVEPFLHKAIDFCRDHDIHINIPERCGVPFCFLGDYMIHSDGYKNNFRWHNENDKSKIDRCDDCILKYKCSGLWNNYIELYGSDEINPQKEVPR